MSCSNDASVGRTAHRRRSALVRGRRGVTAAAGPVVSRAASTSRRLRDVAPERAGPTLRRRAAGRDPSDAERQASRATPFLDIRTLVLERRRAGLALGRVPPGLRDRTTCSTSTTPTRTATRAWSSTARTARRRDPVVGAAALLREAAVPEPQRRPARVRPGRPALRRHGRRAARAATRTTTARRSRRSSAKLWKHRRRTRGRRAAGARRATGCATRGASRSTGRTGDLYIGDVGQGALGGDRLRRRAPGSARR